LIVLTTSRLVLRQLTEDDAPFILELVNDPAWLRYIGDRGVRNVADAQAYIRNGPVASYARNGFGLWLVARTGDNQPLGICGLIRRETLPDVDLGFAFLPQFTGRGFAREAATATLAHGRTKLGLRRIVAVCSPDNTRSIHLLEFLGLRFEKTIHLTPEAPEVKLFAVEF
jgi:[ribosomal protein S5]-alanine N-acetyltransferase